MYGRLMKMELLAFLRSFCIYANLEIGYYLLLMVQR